MKRRAVFNRVFKEQLTKPLSIEDWEIVELLFDAGPVPTPDITEPVDTLRARAEGVNCSNCGSKSEVLNSAFTIIRCSNLYCKEHCADYSYQEWIDAHLPKPEELRVRRRFISDLKLKEMGLDYMLKVDPANPKADYSEWIPKW